jgi:predicted RNA-binding protein YlxR (DUF448 family)
MVRFVLAPDGTVTPDISRKLPGRGAWVRADKLSLEKAIKTKAFTRSFKGKTDVPDGLVHLTEDLLARKVLGLLSMAVKSGKIHMGFDQVKSAAASGPLAWRIEASDGSPDGRGKIRVLTKAVSRELDVPMPRVVACFTAAELGSALQRESMVHAALKPGSLASSFAIESKRLGGFRTLIPADWPDKAHEIRGK